jgi:hypothetical protein
MDEGSLVDITVMEGEGVEAVRREMKEVHV